MTVHGACEVCGSENVLLVGAIRQLKILIGLRNKEAEKFGRKTLKMVKKAS